MQSSLTQTFCIHTSVRRSVALHSGSTRFKLSIGTELVYTQLYIHRDDNESRGTFCGASVLRSPQKRPKFGLWYSSRCISSWEESSSYAYLTVYVLKMFTVYLGCKGNTEKPNKLAVIICFTMSKSLNKILKCITFLKMRMVTDVRTLCALRCIAQCKSAVSDRSHREISDLLQTENLLKSSICTEHTISVKTYSFIALYSFSTIITAKYCRNSSNDKLFSISKQREIKREKMKSIKKKKITENQ